MEINYLSVLVAAIVSMVVGSIWYGPLFGKKFRQESGMDQWSPERQAQEKKKMGKLYAAQFVASLVMFCVLARLMVDLDKMTVNGGITVAFFTWLGFVMPVQLGNAIWGGKMSLFWIGATNMLVTLLVASVIIGAWR